MTEQVQASLNHAKHTHLQSTTTSFEQKPANYRKMAKVPSILDFEDNCDVPETPRETVSARNVANGRFPSMKPKFMPLSSHSGRTTAANSPAPNLV